MSAAAPPPLDPAVVAAAAAAVVLLLLASGALALRASLARARLQRRIAAVARPRALPPREAKEARQTDLRRRVIQSRLKAVGAAGAGSKDRGAALRQALLQAGLAMSLRDYFLLGVALGGGAALLSLLFGLGPLGALPMAVSVGFGLPRLTLRMMAQRRRTAFTRHFADAIDVIVRGIRAGLPVGECLNIIARESPLPVAREFRTITEEVRLGLTLEQSLERAVGRMPTTEMRFFATALVIQQQSGGNLAEVLSNLSNVLRGRHKLKEKVKALSAEARTSAAIIGCLPLVVGGAMSLTSPAYIGLLVTEPLGHVMLAGSAVWMAIGVLVMRKMIRFDA